MKKGWLYEEGRPEPLSGPFLSGTATTHERRQGLSIDTISRLLLPDLPANTPVVFRGEGNLARAREDGRAGPPQVVSTRFIGDLRQDPNGNKYFVGQHISGNEPPTQVRVPLRLVEGYR